MSDKKYMCTIVERTKSQTFRLVLPLVLVVVDYSLHMIAQPSKE